MGDAYPLSEVTEILDHLGQNIFFCREMVMGYNQIQMAEGTEQKRHLAQKKVTGNIGAFSLD